MHTLILMELNRIPHLTKLHDETLDPKKRKRLSCLYESLHSSFIISIRVALIAHAAVLIEK